jgi:hypothetical protein
MKIDRDTVRAIRQQINDALAPIGKSLGVTVEVEGSATFTASNINFKVVVAKTTKDGVVLTKEAEAWKRLASMYGLDPEALGKTFTYGGKEYKITGLATRRGRFPVQADRVSDGRGFKFPVEAVKPTYPANQ